MPLWSAFVGPSYTMRSAAIDTEDTINLFAETRDAHAGSQNVKQSTLYGTPGLLNLGSVTDTICRGMFSQDGRTFTVIGSTLYEIILSGTGVGLTASFTSRGTLANDGAPVYFASNGSGSPGGGQLAISSAGKLYVFTFSSNTLSASITLPLTNNAGMVRFLNGYFLLVEITSLKVWFSELEDGTTWNALDWFARSNTSDNVVGIETLFDQVRVFGTKTSEVFYDVGEADNPFIPYPGSITQDGAINATSIGRMGDSIVWVSKNEWDMVRVLQVGSGEPKVISTAPVEFAWAAYSTVTDVEVLIYEQEAHQHAVWTFPTADISWGYDGREGQWHKRSSRQSGDSLTPPIPQHRWRCRGTCAPGSQVILVGDYLTGNVYELSLDIFTDNCAAIPRIRRAPYLDPENQWLFLDQVELGCQTGVGTATGTGINANVNLRLSRDFGNTYTPVVTASMGTQNSFRARPIWRKLGRVRSDRLVLELSITDPVRVVWGPGVWLRTAPGSGAL